MIYIDQWGSPGSRVVSRPLRARDFRRAAADAPWPLPERLCRTLPDLTALRHGNFIYSEYKISEHIYNHSIIAVVRPS